MNLARVDLDLFVVLHAVLEERSATRAAARLHVTRPAVSNSIRRLRELFGDPLVVRSGGGLRPTPRALLLAPIVSSALEQLRSALESRGEFDPALSTRRFSVACSDYEQVAVLPAILERFERQLPKARLKVTRLDQMLATRGLETGELDCVLGMVPGTPPGCLCEPLLTDDLVCVVRNAHPKARSSLSLDAFLALGEVEVALFDDRPSVGAKMASELLGPHGRSRNIVFSVPTFAAAALAVSRTDRVAVLPRRVVQAFASSLRLRTVALRLELPKLELKLVWSARSDADPGAQFFRGVVRRAVGPKRGRPLSAPRRE